MVFGTVLLAASIASLAITDTTGKGVSDHALSAVAKQDCKISRIVMWDDICQPEGSVVVSSPTGPVIVLNSNNNVQAMEVLFEQRKQSYKK